MIGVSVIIIVSGMEPDPLIVLVPGTGPDVKLSTPATVMIMVAGMLSFWGIVKVPAELPAV